MLTTNATVVSGLVQMGANWLESVILVFTLDFCKFDEALAFHYYLNWLWSWLGDWKCNGDSGGYEHQRGKNLREFQEHGDVGKQKLWLNYIVEVKERVVGLANERNDK